MAKGRGWVQNALYEPGFFRGLGKIKKAIKEGTFFENPGKAEERAAYERLNKRVAEGNTEGDSISKLKRKKMLEDLED